jgi:hypothetical protein
MIHKPSLTLPHAKEQSVGIPRYDPTGSLTQEQFSAVRLMRQ